MLHPLLLPNLLLSDLRLTHPVFELLLIATVDHGLDRSRLLVQISHRGAEAFMPHHFFDESGIFRLCHGYRPEGVPGTIELQGIRNPERARKFPEPVSLGKTVTVLILGTSRSSFQSRALPNIRRSVRMVQLRLWGDS